MANYVYIATSLDSYIADKNGGIDWLMNIPNPDRSDYGFNDFMQKIDALVMGKNTFQTVLSLGEWPYNKKVFILSNTLNSIPDHLKEKAEIISGKPKEINDYLAERGYKNLYIDGGKVIQSFLEEDLIDEIIITRIPVILGDGIPLFGKLEKPINFSEVRTEVLSKLLVKTYYKK